MKYRNQILNLQQFCDARELSPTFAVITRVVDGDTLKLQSGATVRVLGIDTPEICHPDAHGKFDPTCHDEFQFSNKSQCSNFQTLIFENLKLEP